MLKNWEEANCHARFRSSNKWPGFHRSHCWQQWSPDRAPKRHRRSLWGTASSWHTTGTGYSLLCASNIPHNGTISGTGESLHKDRHCFHHKSVAERKQDLTGDSSGWHQEGHLKSNPIHDLMVVTFHKMGRFLWNTWFQEIPRNQWLSINFYEFSIFDDFWISANTFHQRLSFAVLVFVNKQLSKPSDHCRIVNNWQCTNRLNLLTHAFNWNQNDKD